MKKVFVVLVILGLFISSLNFALAKEVSIWAQVYTPTKTMQVTPANPYPRQALKILAERYNKLHPDVTIKIIEKPATADDRQWILTQMSGGTIPDICWAHVWWVNEDIPKGWWVNLDPFLAQPNPYVEGNKKWLDLFLEGPTQAKISPDGHLYIIPIDLVSTLFFYNKDIFDKVGVGAPKTWAEFMDVCAKLQGAGYLPIASGSFAGFGWSWQQLGDMVMWKMEEDIRKLSNLPPTGRIPQEAIAKAVKKGVYNCNDDQYKEWMRLLKDWSKYWTKDWAASGVDFAMKFRKGEVAIYEDGTWRWGELKKDPLVKFKWGAFFTPTLTKDTSKFAATPPRPAKAIGGATAAQWGVTYMAEKRGVVNEAVDFIRYVTTPKNCGYLVNELGFFIPNVKGAPMNPDLRPIFNQLKNGGEETIFTYGDKLTEEYGQERNRIFQRYILGQIDLETAVKENQSALEKAADTMIEKYGWKF
jgi:ABC-type glycerol-3-phosphate transport system substrate-binding protein